MIYKRIRTIKKLNQNLTVKYKIQFRISHIKSMKNALFEFELENFNCGDYMFEYPGIYLSVASIVIQVKDLIAIRQRVKNIIVTGYKGEIIRWEIDTNIK